MGLSLSLGLHLCVLLRGREGGRYTKEISSIDAVKYSPYLGLVSCCLCYYDVDTFK